MREELKAPGKDVEVEITKSGFVVWVTEKGIRHWVLDASTIRTSNMMTISRKNTWHKIHFKTKLSSTAHGLTTYELVGEKAKVVNRGKKKDSR